MSAVEDAKSVTAWYESPAYLCGVGRPDIPHCAVTSRVFDTHGVVRREWKWRMRRLALARWLRQMRPRIRVKIVLFPRTQRRMAALEARVETLTRLVEAQQIKGRH